MTNSYFIKRERCPACENDHATNLYSRSYTDPVLRKYLKGFYDPQGGVEFGYLENAMYSLLECSNCNLVYQEYIPNDFLMKKLYEQWIHPDFGRKETQGHTLDYYLRHTTEVINILSLFPSPSSELHFLDFGMGWGEWCLMAKAFGCQVYGMELSDERIAHAKNNGITVLNWEDVPSRQFDFINTEQVFEHIPHPLATLKYLAGSLKKNGIIKLSVPNGNSVRRNLKVMDWSAPKFSKYSLNMVAPLEHINCFGTGTLLGMAKQAGLEHVMLPTKMACYSTWKSALRTKLRPYYMRFLKGGSTTLFFRKM